MPASRDPRRVGGAAHQGAVVLLRCEGGVLRQPRQQDQEPHLRVQLPALRAGADVGRDDRRDPRAGRRGAALGAGHAPRARRQPRRRGRGGRDVVHAPRSRHLVAAAARGRAAWRARAAPQHVHRRGERACATATSSPSRSSSTARTCSPTTGSTSTSPACGSAGSRTSARGRRGWFPTRRRPASAWSTSASRATISGRWTTTTSSRSPPTSSSGSGSRRSRRSSAATRSACRRRTRSTTPTTRSACR